MNRIELLHDTRTRAALVLAFLCTGCASERMPGSEGAGQTVRAALASQIVNPDAARTAPAVPSLHGAAAKASIDRMVRSFEAPAPAANLFTIGVGTGAGGSTASPAAVPRAAP